MWRKVTAYLFTVQTGYSEASLDRQGINYAVIFEHTFVNGISQQHLTLFPLAFLPPPKTLTVVKILEQY